MGYGYESIKDIDKSVIDWSGLTKNISDNLVAEADRRDKLKSELAKTNQEELNKLNEFEQGLDPSANKWILQQAQQARQYKLQNYKMMTQGLKSIDDAKLVSQNVMDGWTNLNSALKTYNQNFKTISETPGKANTAILEEMADFMNLKNKKITYDPKSGETFIAEIDPGDGRIVEGSLKPIRVLNSVQAQKFNMLDLDAETTKISTNTAAYDLARSGGASVKNPRLNPIYKNWLDNSVKSILSSEDAMASVLLDHLGLDYTRDKNEEGKEITYTKIKGYDSDGIPITELVTETIKPVLIEYKDGRLSASLTDRQKKLAEETAKTSIESKLAVTTKAKPIVKENVGDRKMRETYKLIEGALSGNLSDLQSLANSYGFREIKPIAGVGFSVITKNGETKYIKGDNVQDAGKSFASILVPGSGENFANAVKNKNTVSGEFEKNIAEVGYTVPAKTIPQIKKATYDLLNDLMQDDKFEASQLAARDLGLPISIVKKNNETGVISINGKTVNTTAEIIQELENYREQQTPQEAIILDATERKK